MVKATYWNELQAAITVHSSHHAPIDEETSMTAVKRLAGHKARRFTFLPRAQSSKTVNTNFVTLATMLQSTKKLQRPPSND
ncbi:hypothetical protein COP1_034436 [Malus domestica]